MTGIGFAIRIIESKAEVTFLTCCHEIMHSQFMGVRENFAFVGVSQGFMFTYKVSAPKGVSDAFICIKRHENISYISKMGSTSVASSLLFR